MKHNILGEIERPADGSFDGVATVRHDQRDLKIHLSGDGQPLEITVGLAAELARQLAELDRVAQQVAVADLLATCNGGWNEYDEVQEDGSLQAVSNPPLTGAEFAARLKLEAVNVTGDQMIEFFYNDDGMFWGHSVVVTSLHGVDLTEADADLHG